MPPSLRARNQKIRKVKANNRAGSVVSMVESQCGTTSASTATSEAVIGPSLPLDESDIAKFELARGESSVDTSYPDEPPRFVIDMSLPAEERYIEVAKAMRNDMLGLTYLFDDVMSSLVWFLPIFLLRVVCKLLLRRVHSDEEMAELRGIAKVTGLDIYLLVTFNVLLDMLMGCSSGGALIGDGEGSTKMLHFRTLDWGMTDLRRVVVRLDYVKGKDQAPIASSITYAGFVGVLTGVRKGLSISLNFRRTRVNKKDRFSSMKFIWHKLAVLLGHRPSIASTLRSFLLNETGNDYDSLRTRLVSPECCTTACYLTLCDGKEVTIFEKDRVSAVTRTSEIFENVTNNDADDDVRGSDATTEAGNSGTAIVTGMEMLQDESIERRECSRRSYTSLRDRRFRSSRATRRQGAKAALGSSPQTEDECRDAARLLTCKDVVALVQKYPCSNECTHYAAVMDPTVGDIIWCRRWIEPIEGPEEC